MGETWKCQKCGSCCEVVACEKLTHDNGCMIYETRPEICRTENFPSSDGMKTYACNEVKKLLNNKRRQVI